jgi:hypothetical protein
MPVFIRTGQKLYEDLHAFWYPSQPSVSCCLSEEKFFEQSVDKYETYFVLGMMVFEMKGHKCSRISMLCVHF